jgi:hypothetical protein
MPEFQPDDRAWVEAVDRYASRAPRPRRRSGSARGRYVLASALVLALTVSPFAVARTGDFIREGKRNPSRGTAKRQTRVVGSSKAYVVKVSNVRNSNGGGAVFTCRATPPREPCIQGANVKSGRAFKFVTDGVEGGVIIASTPGARPFSTNATGVAAGLNADRVDNLHAARIDFRGAVGTGTTEILNFAGLVLRATCSAGPDLEIVADTAVPHSSLHVSGARDPGNSPFARQDNDLNPGDNFDVLFTNDDSTQGAISYASPAGTQATVSFLAEEGQGFGGSVNCLFTGTAMGGP